MLIPLILDVDISRDIVNRMKLFGRGSMPDLDKIAGVLNILSIGMRTVRRVSITDIQERRLKDAFLEHNISLCRRPLVIPRDLEVLLRFVNVIVASNFFRRKTDKLGEYFAEDSDIESAIDIFNHLIYLRKQLYQFSETKQVQSVPDKLFDIINDRGEVTTKELREICLTREVCSESSLYRYIDKLINRGQIKYLGKSSEKSRLVVDYEYYEQAQQGKT